MRKYLTYEKNYIDCIIRFPGDSNRYMRPEIICVFKKNRSSDDVLFIDLTNEDVIKKVPLSRIRAARKYNQLDNEMIKKLTDTYAERQIISKYSNIASISKIADNDFNLSVSRYVDTFEGEFIQLSDLANEKEEITSKIKELNKKIDKMMEELDIKF